jgi:hypothetical protein
MVAQELRVEAQAWSRTIAETDRAETIGVAVDPGALDPPALGDLLSAQQAILGRPSRRLPLTGAVAEQLCEALSDRLDALPIKPYRPLVYRRRPSADRRWRIELRCGRRLCAHRSASGLDAKGRCVPLLLPSL